MRRLVSAGITALVVLPPVLLPAALGGSVARAAGVALPECSIVGTAGDDRLVGSAGNDVICGRGGNDVLFGRGGHDLLIGGDGDDRLSGGPGDDLLLGGPGRDRLFGGLGRDWLLPAPIADAGAQYAEMWALDVAAMHSHHASGRVR